jgi:hypothetical protein
VVAHQPETAATRPVRPAHAAACSPPTASPPATGGSARRLAAWSRSGHARRPPPAHNPARVRHRPPTDHRATPGGVARPQGSSAVDPAARRPGRHRDLDSLRWCRVARPPRPGPAPPPEVRGDGRDRTDGQTADGWTLDGWTAEGWTPEGWTPEGWTADGVDSGRVDGSRPDRRTPDDGTR